MKLINMSSLYLFALAVVAALVGVSQASCYGRPPPIRPLPPPGNVLPECLCYDDVNALLLLAKAVENSNSNAYSNSNNVDANEIIKSLLNALVYTTTSMPVCNCGTGGAGGAPGGAGGMGGAGGKGGNGGKPASSTSPLIGLGLLDGEDIANLSLLGKTILQVSSSDLL